LNYDEIRLEIWFFLRNFENNPSLTIIIIIVLFLLCCLLLGFFVGMR
jgi:hypothetical protein